MKRTIFTLSLFGIMLFAANTASAKGVIIYSNGEKIELAKELPADVTIDGTHVNLGVMYDQFAIFWIPMWNYGETKFVLVNDKKNTYWDVDEETIEILKTDFNVEISEKPTIGFWNKIGGKLIWGALILLAIWGWWSSRNDEDEDDVKETEEAVEEKE